MYLCMYIYIYKGSPDGWGVIVHLLRFSILMCRVCAVGCSIVSSLCLSVEEASRKKRRGSRKSICILDYKLDEKPT